MFFSNETLSFILEIRHKICLCLPGLLRTYVYSPSRNTLPTGWVVTIPLVDLLFPSHSSIFGDSHNTAVIWNRHILCLIACRKMEDRPRQSLQGASGED